MARAALDSIVIRKRSGPVVAGARVYIYDRDTTDQVDVYKTDTDGGDEKYTQPLIATADGALPGWVEPGRYDAKASSDPDTTHIEAGVVGSQILTGSALGRLAGDFPDPHFSDAAMEALADLTPAADKLAYFTGSTGAALTTLSSFWRGVLDDPDGDTTRATLGLDHLERPEYHGAVGDGSTNDYAALQAALDTGRSVWLTPGKTYLCRRTLDINTNGQVIHGNGATIKAPTQAVTTTTTTITSGATSSITVASAANLRVGDAIVIEKSGTFDTTSRRITAINGTTVSISGTFGMSSSGTTNVYYALTLFGVVAEGVRITGLVMDGNKSNWTWGRWQHTAAVLGDVATEKNLMVDHCTVKNWYGDGIDPAGPGAVIAYNWIENMAGRGIVFSGTAGSPTNIGTRCIGNHVLTCNTDTNTGGNDGLASIDFSQGGPNTLIQGNYIDTGYIGIRSAAQQNKGINVIANEIHNMTNNGIEVNVTGVSTAHGSITIRDNELDTIGGKGIYVSADGSITNVLKRLGILNNELRSVTGIGINVLSPTSGKTVSEVQIVGNTIYATSGSSSPASLIEVGRIQNGSIRGNILLGGQYGIKSTTTLTNVSIAKNVCTGQYTRGIYADTGTGVLVVHNRVISDSTKDAANWTGVELAVGDANANYIDGQAGGLRLMRISGTNQLIRGNHLVQGSAGIGTLLLAASSANCVVTANYMDANLSDSGSNNMKFGNVRSANGPVSGAATLVAGTVTVSTPEIKTGDNVILSRKTIGGTVGNLSLGTITDGTSFVINSSDAGDTSTVFWQIVH